jgi:hypothetical protein
MISASEWARQNIASRFRDELITALGLALFAIASAFVTTFVVFGLFLMFGIVLGSLGIPPPHPMLIAPATVVIQLIVFYAIKPKDVPSLSVERTEDTGELILVRPHRSERPSYFHNQEGAGSLRHIVATIGLCTAVAIYEVLRHLKKAMQIKANNAEHVAYLTDYLNDRGMKATLSEIERDLHSIDLAELLPQIERLPGFNLVMGEPQGVALTDNALEEMARCRLRTTAFLAARATGHFESKPRCRASPAHRARSAQLRAAPAALLPANPPSGSARARAAHRCAWRSPETSGR